MITALLIEGSRERKKLDKVRLAIKACEQDLEDLASAAFPVDESLDRILRQVDEQQELAATRLSYFTRPGDGPQLPATDAGFLSLLLGRDELERLLRARLEEMTPRPGLSRMERERTLSELRAKLAVLEEQEEIEICALEAQGCVVDRRQVDAELLLAVWDRTEPTSG